MSPAPDHQMIMRRFGGGGDFARQVNIAALQRAFDGG
jgi:hypothetical protein